MLLYTTPRFPHTAAHYMNTYGNKVGLQMMELVLTPAITKTGLMNQTPQSWYQTPQSWYQILQSWYQILKSWYQTLQSWYQTLPPAEGKQLRLYSLGCRETVTKGHPHTQRNCEADEGPYNKRQGRH